jgi:hypothetical protein
VPEVDEESDFGRQASEPASPEKEKNSQPNFDQVPFEEDLKKDDEEPLRTGHHVEESPKNVFGTEEKRKTVGEGDDQMDKALFEKYQNILSGTKK